MINAEKLELSAPEKERDEEWRTRREFTGWNNWGKTEDTPHEWNRCSNRGSDSGKKNGGRVGKNKGTWRGESTNNLKRKHRLKSLRKESKGFARVGWILDYGLRFWEEEGRAGGKNKDNFGQGNNIDPKEPRIDLPKTKRFESTWREMHRIKEDGQLTKLTTWS